MKMTPRVLLLTVLVLAICSAASFAFVDRERILMDPPPQPSGGSGVEVGPPGLPRWVELDDFILGDVPPLLLRSDPEPTFTKAIGPMPPIPRVAFDAITSNGTAVPPDTHIAVGPLIRADGRVMMVTNEQVAIWDKLGQLVAGPITLNAFFGIATSFDPKVLYDQHSGRFFVVVLEGNTPNPGGTNNIHIAVSSSGVPGNLTSDWTFSVGTGLTTVGGFNTWSDYPGIGADNLALFVTMNLFDAGGAFRGIKIRVFNKTQLAAGNYVFTDFNLDAATTNGLFTAQPAHVYGSTANGGFYLISRVGQTTYRLHHITGHPAAPVHTTNTFAWAAGAAPADTGADQCTVANPDISTVATRMQNAIYRDGRIWCTLAADPDGDGQVEVVWQAISDNSYPTGTPAVSQSGFINGSGTAPWTYMPSININTLGDAVIVYTQSSATECPNMYYAARLSPDPPGMFQTPVLVRSSAGFYDSFSASDPDRWGDYAATVIDPTDDSFWIAQEYASTSAVGSSRWGTHIAGFETDCNLNGVYDPLDITGGSSEDINGNGIPDECEDLGVDCMQKFTAIDSASGDEFGISIAISGTRAIVGAHFDDDNGFRSGSAYIFDSTTGLQLFKLLADDGATNDRFGPSVGISGTRAIVGAPLDGDNGHFSGSAYVFDTTTGLQLFKLLPNDGATNDRFGHSVAISGTTAIVGAIGDDDNGSASGSSYIFDTTTGQQLFKLLPNDGAAIDLFGFSVAISGTRAIVGALEDDNGSAYIFDTTTGLQLFKLLPDDVVNVNNFGTSIAISGNTAIVGASSGDGAGRSGSAYLFDTTTGLQLVKLLPNDGESFDEFGWSVAISGTRAIVGAHFDDDNGNDSGSAYLFDITTGTQIVKLLPSDTAAGDFFGSSVAINSVTAIVGATGGNDVVIDSGSAYIICGVSDCNGNNELDGCEFKADPTLDLNANCILDECDVDCNTNGQADFLDIIFGTSDDCNGNGVPDECDIADGTSLDTNSNGIPDSCDFINCPSDFDLSGDVNVTDLLQLLAAWGPNPGHVTDSNDDGNVNVTDLLDLLAAWGACP